MTRISSLRPTGFALGVVAVAALAGFSPDASGQVIYSDSFNRTTGSGDGNGNPAGAGNGSSDWGTNDNAFGGTIAQSWVTGPPGRAGGANQVTDGSQALSINGGGAYNFDAAALSPQGFSVGFDFNRDPDGGGSGSGYLGVGLGAPITTASADIGGGAFVINNADVAILFQQGAGTNTGNTQFYQDAALLQADPNQGPVDYGNPEVSHSVLLTFTPQVAGMYGETDLIDVMVQVSGATPNPYNLTVQGGDDFGTLSFSSNGFILRAYDNVVVTTIPEPASLVLLGLGGLAMLTRRRA